MRRTRFVATVVQADCGVHAYDAYSNQILKPENQAEEEILRAIAKNKPRRAVLSMVQQILPGQDAEQRLAGFEARCLEEGVLQQVDLRSMNELPVAAELKAYLESHIQSIVLGVTEECSLRCRYCVYGGAVPGHRMHSRAVMSLATAKKAVKFYLEHSSHLPGPLSVCFYGGEPLLRPRFLRSVMDYARAQTPKELSFHLTTNGLALNRTEIRQMLVAYDVALLVSLDGPQELHDRWRVTKKEALGSHALIEAGLSALLEEFPGYYQRKVMFSAVLTPPSSTTRVVDYFQSSRLFLSSSRILRLSQVNRGAGDNFLGLDDAAATMHEARSMSRRYVQTRANLNSRENDGLESVYQMQHAFIAQRPMSPLPARFVPRGYCIPGARKLFVCANGDLGICEKVGEVLKIGDLESGIDVQVVRQVLTNLRSFFRPACSWCVAQRFCSMCPASVMQDGSMSRTKFREQCRSNRVSFASAIKTYIEIASRNPGYERQLKLMKIT